MCFLFFIFLVGGLLRGQVLFRSFMKLAAPSGATQAPSRSASARAVALCAGRWARLHFRMDSRLVPEGGFFSAVSGTR